MYSEACATSAHTRLPRGRRILSGMIFEPVIRMPATWSSVCASFAIHLFEGHVSLAEMDQMQAIGERWTAQRPGKRVEMVLIFPSNVRMTHEERSRMAKVIQAGEAHRTASATIILAQGMLASMQRSMLTGLLMIAPPPHPAKVFGAIPDALSWLEPHARAVAGPALRFDDLTTAIHAHVAEFRDRLPARSVRPHSQPTA
jgi:hypothetical protein